METLFAKKMFNGLYSLQDAKGNHFGSFKSIADMAAWTKEAGYRLRDDKDKEVKFA